MDLLLAIWDLVLALWAVVTVAVQTLIPWIALIAWVAFWLFAVNWRKLTPMLYEQGGIVGVVLLLLMAILVWGTVAPPVEGVHYISGMTVSNFVGKTVYVTALAVIAMLCGSVQVSGACDRFCCIQQVEETLELNSLASHGGDHHGHVDDHGHHDHGGGHGHGHH